MRWSLLVLALAWMLLVPVPALSQPSQEGPSGAQYDQYGPVAGVGGQAVHDAIVASGAIRASAEEAQAATEEAQAAAEEAQNAGEEAQNAGEEAQNADEGAVSAAERSHATGGPDLASAGTAEAQDETSPDLEKLPNTGGPSPLWLGVPLLCAGGLLARRILL